jgi:hypothetical protein
MNKFHEDGEKKDDAAEGGYDWQQTVCAKVMDEWDKGQAYCSELNRLYEDIYSMIRGERPQKNYDWQSNIVINKVFQTIWTAIPYLTQKIFGASPLVGVDSFDKKGASQREKILEFWYTMQTTTDKRQTTFFLIMVMWLLRSLLNGVGILKKGWHQKLKSIANEIEEDVPLVMDEAGAVLKSEKITRKLKKTIPIEDWPVNVVCNNRDVVVDWLLKPGQSIRHGRFIIHRSVEDVDSIKSSDIKYFNLDQLDYTGSQGESDTERDHSPMKGKDGQDSPPKSEVYGEVEIYERVGKWPVYKERLDGYLISAADEPFDESTMKYMEIVIAVAKIKDKKVLVRFDKNEYEQMNYVDMHIYLDEERWHSIGMTEPVMDMQTALNDNINAVFDKIWQELMPPVVVNKFALWDWDTMQYAPRQRWLVGGPPAESIYFKESSPVTRDAYTNHMLFDNEIQLGTSITPPMQGMGKEKAATTNVMNAQFSAGKLDFLVKMIETTGIVPCAQMDVAFAKKFAHPLTFQAILGEPFQYSDWEEIYKYRPAASSVKLEHQKDNEIQQDIQLIQIFSSVQNPGVAKILNILWSNILRNRNMPKEAATFDEDYYEPSSDAGNIQMIRRMGAPGAVSNQNKLPMTGAEQNVRRVTYAPRGMFNAQ